MEQNQRIYDLREKLNRIKKIKIDTKTKSNINKIKQEATDEKEEEDSGPYSLLFALQDDCAKSFADINEVHKWNRLEKEGNAHYKQFSSSNESVHPFLDRLPNVLNFEGKSSNEFEYSCENEVKKSFNTHSRSDLCLQLKSNIPVRPNESSLSPNDNSISRTNDENSLDDSLGILTPDQMEDMCYLEIAFSPSTEGSPSFCDKKDYHNSPDNGDSPSTDKTETNSAASTIQNDGFEVSNKNDEKIDELRSLKAVLDYSNDKDQTSENNDCYYRKVSVSCLPSNCFPSSEKKDANDLNNFMKVDMDDKLLEEEFMPSIHSSILEPVSSVAGTTVNLELPLDYKNESPFIAQITEQTPSPEDLPLDNSDINGEVSSYSQFSGSTIPDLQTYSDNKNDYPKSMDTSKVSNSCITSITSITSLDGYQGDGEMSRPVSRTADHSIGHREDNMDMDWQNVPVARRIDPMTDSDFFTESDADGLDDNVQRGDRKAQVIDGALYGGNNSNANPPLFVNRNEDSCMESSGIYTDFENHRSSPVFLNVIDDISPEGSTPSTRSECSQKYASNAKLNDYFHALDSKFKKDKCIESHIKADETQKASSKINSLCCDKDLICNEKNKEEKKSFTLKKYKMPRRDVPSKLKTMLTRKPESDVSVYSSPKTFKKNERRETSVKKNSLELKNDFKTKSFREVKSKVDCSFSFQRSQTTCTVSRLLNSKGRENNNAKPKSRHMRARLELGLAAGSGKSSLQSSQSDISATSSPGKHTPSRFPSLRNGKKRESAPTPLITPRPPPTQPQPPTPQAKKNAVVQKLSASPVSVRSRVSLVPPPSPRKPTARRTPLQRPTTLATNKEAPRVTTAVAPRSKLSQSPQQPRTQTAPLVPAPALPEPRDCSAEVVHYAKGCQALGVLVQHLVEQLNSINSGSWRAEAAKWRTLAASERTNAERADRDRQQRAQKDLDTISECLSKISELEREVSAKEEENIRLRATHVEDVTKLASEIKDLKITIGCLKREVSESRLRVHTQNDVQRSLRAQLEEARVEVERAYSSCDSSRNHSPDETFKCDAACDPVLCEPDQCELHLSPNLELSTDANKLAAEVRSLRAVIELKQKEVACLRDARAQLEAERERRAVCERETEAARHAAEELRERAAARQRDLDRLREENRRLLETVTREREHAARSTAHIEELRYKLRTKSQVVSLLANGGYVERANVRARSLSGSSERESPAPSDSPPEPSSPAPHDRDPTLPAVKAVVEKHDSVSWVLDIEESPEEKASRLARKSSFRNTNGSTAVKRRGGSSPGGGSPAPASPAPNASKLFRPGELDFPPHTQSLKESAGEAIYIYDDRQY